MLLVLSTLYLQSCYTLSADSYHTTVGPELFCAKFYKIKKQIGQNSSGGDDLLYF